MKDLTITLSVNDKSVPLIDTQESLPPLTMIDGVAYCSSLQVAESFGKKHNNVLRDIDQSVTQVIESLGKLKFEPFGNLFTKTTYKTKNNLGFEVDKPMYLLTRDGFTLLVMGYEGKKAMRFKLDYMAAFKAMESQLNTPKPDANERISSDQHQDLLNRVLRATDGRFDKKATHRRIIDFLKFLYSLDNLRDLPKDKYQEAVEQLDAAKADNLHIDGILIDIKKELVRLHICGNAPLTSSLRRRYKDHFVNKYRGENVDWMQLAAQMYYEDLAKDSPATPALN